MLCAINYPLFFFLPLKEDRGFFIVAASLRSEGLSWSLIVPCEQVACVGDLCDSTEECLSFWRSVSRSGKEGEVSGWVAGCVQSR